MSANETINDSNYELYLLRYKENDLNDEERSMVEAALEERPDWRELADLYDPELRIAADESIHFPNKEMLRFGTPHPTKTTSRQLWVSLSAVASVVLLLAVGLRMLHSDPSGLERNPTTASTKTSTTIIGKKAQTPLQFEPSVSTPPPSTNNKEVTPPDTDNNTPLQPVEAATPDTLVPVAIPILTDKLIVYLDDSTDSDAPSRIPLQLTDQLITCVDLPDDTTTPSQPAPINPISSRFINWINNIQIAQIEWETSLINRLAIWKEQ